MDIIWIVVNDSGSTLQQFLMTFKCGWAIVQDLHIYSNHRFIWSFNFNNIYTHLYTLYTLPGYYWNFISFSDGIFELLTSYTRIHTSTQVLGSKQPSATGSCHFKET